MYTPETNEAGEVVGWIASVTDMTAFRNAKEQLARVEKLAAAGQLAASLAHEINNPLNAVMNCLYLLESGSSDDQTKKTLIDSASKELARLGRIVSQSLSYYRVGSTPKKVDIAALVHDSLQVFARKFERSGVTVTQKVEPCPVVVGFPDELRQVIDNLLLNAMESMSGRGSLFIRVCPARFWRTSNRAVRLTVADTGCGMPATMRERMFESFFTTKADKGTGLGLWVVRGILAKHRAMIQVRSRNKPERSGTAISILCPAVEHVETYKVAISSSEFETQQPM